MLISVIIPIYNTEKYLEQCLESVINQSYKNIEIIIINDGSTDNSKKICEKYKKLDNRVKYIDKINEGVSKALNIGIEMVTGNYIYMMDSDDYIDSNTIENLVNTIKKNEYPDIIKSTCFNVVKNNEIHPYKQTIVENELNKKLIIKDNLETLLELIFINPPLWYGIYKSDIIKKLRFNEVIKKANYQDYLMSIELLFNSQSIVLVKYPFYYYRISSNQHSNNLENVIDFLSSTKHLNKCFENTNNDIKHKFINNIFQHFCYQIDHTKYNFEKQQCLKQFKTFYSDNIAMLEINKNSLNNIINKCINYNNIYNDQIYYEPKISIEILLKIDDNTKLQNLILFYSIIKNAKHNINFSILIPVKFEEYLIQLFLNLIKKYNNKLNLKNTIHFIKTNLDCDFISEIHLIKPNLKRILYLKHNLIIKQDLYKIYATEFNDDQIIGVFDVNFDLMVLNLKGFKKNNINNKYKFNKVFIEHPIDNLKTIMNENEITIIDQTLNKKIKHIDNDDIFNINFNDDTKCWYKYLTELQNEL